MKKTLLAILMVALAFAVSSCKRSNVADPTVNGPTGFSIIMEGTASPDVLLVDGVRHASLIRVQARDASNNPLVGKTMVFSQSDGSAQLDWGVFENMAPIIQKVTGSDGVAWATFYGPTTLLGTQMYILAQMTIEGSNITKNCFIPIYLSRPNPQNSPPVVNITVPTANAVVNGTVPIIAQAADENGLATVDCLIDGVSIGNQTATASNTYTFSMDCSKYGNGNHTIEVVAFDTQGLKGADTVIVRVNNQNSQVTVSITAPAANATVSGSAVSIIALAFADSGISKVDCYIDNSIIATLSADSSNTYTFTWDSSHQTNGIHGIKVMAVDTNGSSASDTINVVVLNSGPTVDITLPAPNATVSGTVAITALATSNSGMSRVDCYIDGTIISTLPAATNNTYEFSWDSSQYANATHAIKVTAVATNGLTVSDSINVVVQNAGPVVNITAPLAGAVVSATVAITALATSDYGIDRVDCYIDGGMIDSKAGTATSDTYSFSWVSTQVKNGGHTIKVTAIDKKGVSTSDSTSVTVNNTDAQPTAEIIYPINDSTIILPPNTIISVKANATDDKGISRVSFYVNGTLVHNMSKSGDLYQYNWLPPQRDGTCLLYVIAYDTINQATVSAEVKVTINIDNGIPPEVDITYPAQGAEVKASVEITALATADLGILRVEFYIDSKIIGRVTGHADSDEYSFTWKTTGWVNGTRTIEVKAFDTNGIEANDTITVTVNN